MEREAFFRSRSVRLTGAALLCVLLSACAGLPPDDLAPQIRYFCDNDRQFAMRFFPGTDGAEIELNHMRFKLRHQVSDAGRRYACDVMTFSEQAGLADLVVDGAPAYRNCRPAQ